MPSRIDTSVIYSIENLPTQRAVENPRFYPIATTEPPTQVVSAEPYLPDPDLVKVVNLAIALGRPLLLQGDPGCGKTRLAHAVAFALGFPLEEVYIKSTSRAQDLLYTYDAITRLYDAQLGAEGPCDQDGEPLARHVENYIRLGPLGRAIVRAQAGRPSAVLIDEIDKADLDFPNDLLWELDRLEFRVAEAPEMSYAAGKVRPIVFITHNEEKPLPPAFLRRCIFHYVEFPKNKEDIDRILALHEISDEPLRDKAIDVIFSLRKLDLSKQPGLSELIDWVGYLEAVRARPDDLYELPYVQALLKQTNDQQRAVKELAQAVARQAGDAADVTKETA